MQVKVTNPETNITTIEDVERIQLFFSDETKERFAEVFFYKALVTSTGKQISKNWMSDSLKLDLTDPRLIEALDLFRQVIEEKERVRITASHNPQPATRAPAPTPTPPNKPS